MSSLHDLFLLVLVVILASATVQATCYFPDKSVDTDGYPCNLTAGAVTHCCRTFEACIDNGICYTQWDSQMYRRSCTDENWSDGCPTACSDVSQNGPEGMLACSQGTNPTYCCANGTDNCCSPSTVFNFIPGEFLGVLDAGGTLCPPLPVATTITRTTTANAPSQTTSSNSSSSSSTITSSAGAAAASETSSSPSSSSSDSSSSRTIGLAVGIPLGLLLIASIAGLFWFFNRKLSQEKAERRKLEERLFSLVPANDPSKQAPVGTNIWEKGDADRVGKSVAEIGPAERRNELPVDRATAYEVGERTGTVTGTESGTGTHSSTTMY